MNTDEIRQKIQQVKEQRLTELDLSHNSLTEILIEVFELEWLEKLNLSFNQLTSVPESISRLTNLSELFLSYNQLTSVPESISRLTNLSTLYLHENQLTSVPESITRLTNLSQLYLGDNRLTSVPESITRLTNLSQLDLSLNQLTSVPESITRLTNLSVLDLGFNPLTSVPESITRLTNLSTLNLRSNQLTSVPESITLLTNLSQLNLGDNQLTSVPESITRLTNLSSLDLYGNQLTSVPESISRLTNLSELFLSYNQLTSVPESISRLTNLSTLYLGGNQLTSVPESITRLTNLSTLYLGGNQLTSVPESITRLTNLSQLDLSLNQLTSVPKSISRLTKLSQLDLSSNQLTSVPESITRLTNLSTLDLSDNPLEDPPIEIANQGINAIREYFRQKQAGAETLYEAKLIIIGEGGAGKTTLARKIQNLDSPLPNPDESTQGIDVQEWHFTMENGADFRVNIWDFGGQEIYHATHQFFLTKRALYLLVADSRKEQPHLDYWLNVVELFSDNSPLLLIKNEVSDRPVQIDESQLRGRFNNLKDTFATNLAKYRGGEGLENIIESIKYQISELPHIGTQFPKTWIKIRTILEQDNRNYISLDEYFNICDQNGVTQGQSGDGRLTLSQFLHDLGVILHFQDEKTSLLYKTIILNPKWGTDAVYKVLDNNRVKTNLGKFNESDVSEIWQDSQYNNMQGELLELMLKFKLCYRIKNSNDTYIAPQLLDSNPLQYQWNINDNLFLRYEYDFMPKGILTRFIVEMYRDINEPNVWRSGVILKRDNTLAEVIETYDRREIKIRLSGTNKRGLLEIITHKLDEIHQSYERLRVKKMIPCNCAVCKNSQEPHFYDFEKLRQRIANNKQNIECEKPPYHEVNVLSLIDDTIGREKLIEKGQEGEPRISYHNHIYNPQRVEINQGVNTMEENQNQPIKVKSAWANGSFYLFVFVVVIAGIGFLGNQLSFPVFCVVVIGGILFVPIIGALQLRQDDRLQEENFLELMKLTIGQLPLIGNMLGKVLNPSDNSQESEE
ncbi:leucine-rich repeat domain-containing protein [Planktothrix agardhii 1806]|uniref:leucine-rich repeat domain-containing protein n=1 Tax=Planktothrix agardhii TaxID=1160 RepID=UPI001F40C90E|nr:COR domain-containing protein [Planktothrix agardhii]MCF3570285.1 leucine-rich repeat domain-containing protein [Planktothrix agardhii 1805]MCF3586667.1 leucine-rich repeat domain-containing protein [Planktothrix agardhii 1803]MCF3615561.1 leucine-rich repeat domain-containing protein [Planktothrix agardhii 1806]